MPGISSPSELPDEIHQALLERGIRMLDEVGLRVELERHLSAYTLYRLTPAAARRWKCRYRLMFGDTYLDCQTVSEAYARALLASMPGS
jgi:muramoyltetrapeptide carboxypeptidase LdcA involved in peptidoglycan recycling